jgi:hypothetical protein
LEIQPYLKGSLLSEAKLTGPRNKAAPTQGYQPLTGPCLVIEHKDWSVRFGSYETDAEAEKIAKARNKKRTDGAKARAGRWEDAK